MTSRAPRYDDLSALFFNCTLKRSPERSNTQGLTDLSAGIMQTQGRADRNDPGIHHSPAGRRRLDR